MRALLPLNKDRRNVIGNLISSRSRSACCGKRALSNLVAYVLLISITVSLSVVVYGWLRFYVVEDEIEECSDNVNIIIREYNCTSGPTGSLGVTLKNKGLFTVDGYELRVHDRENATFGIYLLDENGMEIKPGEEHRETYFFASESFDTVTILDVQPFMTDSGEVRCKSHALQEVVCNS